MMLNPELILKGPPSNLTIPNNWSLGKHLIDCQRKGNWEDILCVDGVTNETITCGQFVNNALKLAHALRGLGVKTGDVVTTVSENNIKFPTILAASLYIGATLNPLNPLYATGELNHAMSLSKPKVVFCSKAAYSNVKTVSTKLGFIRNFIVIDTTLEIDANVGTFDALLESVTVNADNVEPAEIIASKDLALILLSSGTTGLPKGVMMSHRNCYLPLLYIGEPCIGSQQGDAAVVVIPFFHVLGICAVFATLAHFTKLILLPSFQPATFLKCIQENKASILYTAPLIIGFLGRHPLVKQFDITSIRMAICGGANLDSGTQEEFAKMHPNAKITFVYGLTETVGMCTFAETSPDHPGSVGPIAPGLEAMVWNADLGTNIEAHKIGELCIKGPTVVKGYIGIENIDVDEYGFYHTGDRGYYDEGGWLYIAGRFKELIKYKGFQVPPFELENLLSKHPAVKDCGVVGIPNERVGQLPAALVVCKEDVNVTEKEIIDYVAERISPQKHLHGGVKFVDSIPRNASGKILRHKLVELYNLI